MAHHWIRAQTASPKVRCYRFDDSKKKFKHVPEMGEDEFQLVRVEGKDAQGNWTVLGEYPLSGDGLRVTFLNRGDNPPDT